MKIIAIGGGSIGLKFKGKKQFPCKPETTIIDKEIIKLSGKKNPRVLFIPTASSDNLSYVNVFKEYYGKRLKCKVDILLLKNKKISKKEVSDKILNTDIIYVGGGNTLMMMNLWKKLGIDNLLKKAVKKDIVLSGLSAGSICWFKYGNSDSRKFKNNNAKLIKVSGLDFLPILLCPHYDKEKDRKSSLKAMTRKMKEVAIALNNCTAIEIIDDKFKIITSKNTANAYKVYWKSGKFFHEKIPKNKDLPINYLISR